jgi:hypothetical protein
MKLRRNKKLFQVTTTTGNCMQVEAKSEFHVRKIWSARYEKMFGSIKTVMDVTPKPAVNVTRS